MDQFITCKFINILGVITFVITKWIQSLNTKSTPKRFLNILNLTIKESINSFPFGFLSGVGGLSPLGFLFLPSVGSGILSAMSSRPKISVIKLNGFIRYFNPIIPSIISPRPLSSYYRSLRLYQINADHPSKTLFVSVDAHENNLSKTNNALSKNVANFSPFCLSPIHFITSVVTKKAPSSSKKLPIGPRNFSAHEKPPLSPFFVCLFNLLPRLP